MAAHVNLSRAYFTRAFRREVGRTPAEYLLEVRMNHAKEMLTEKNLSVAEIAEKCGFANTSHFIRTFRRWVGQTPSSFRNFFNMREEATEYRVRE